MPKITKSQDSDKETPAKCAICLEAKTCTKSKARDQNAVYQLSCLHSFHQICLQQLLGLGVQHSCPLCRVVICDLDITRILGNAESNLHEGREGENRWCNFCWNPWHSAPTINAEEVEEDDRNEEVDEEEEEEEEMEREDDWEDGMSHMIETAMMHAAPATTSAYYAQNLLNFSSQGRSPRSFTARDSDRPHNGTAATRIYGYHVDDIDWYQESNELRGSANMRDLDFEASTRGEVAVEDEQSWSVIVESFRGWGVGVEEFYYYSRNVETG